MAVTAFADHVCRSGTSLYRTSRGKYWSVSLRLTAEQYKNLRVFPNWSPRDEQYLVD